MAENSRNELGRGVDLRSGYKNGQNRLYKFLKELIKMFLKTVVIKSYKEHEVTSQGEELYRVISQ